jgi:hypothetical protein
MILGVTAPLAYLLFSARFPSIASGRKSASRGMRPAAAPTLGSDPRRAMRKRIRAGGGDNRRVPDAALDEIIQNKTKLAGDLAGTGLSAYANPKSYRDRALHAEADVIVRLLAGQRGFSGAEETLEILERHGAITGAEVARRRLSIRAQDRAAQS